MSKPITRGDLDLLENIFVLEARENFYAFRRYIHPEMKTGWFVREISNELQKFYEDLVAGKKPKLVLSTPPQNGKSSAVMDFCLWLLGKLPNNRTIFASFSERLGVRANLAIQREMDRPKFKKIFPGIKIGKICTRELIDLDNYNGYFRNTTVKGPVTGESLDLGVIDDPLKGWEAASSELIRESTWDWFASDFLTRCSENAGLLIIGTRWNVDDPIGKLIEAFGDGIRALNYPAIAEEDEKYRKKGEALFPELKSLDFLNGVKKIMSKAVFEALYQGHPTIAGGSVIHPEEFQYYKVQPEFEYRAIYADTAQKTKERNDFSVLQCWGKTKMGNGIYLIDQIRGKWEAPELKRKTVAFWNKHAEFNSYEQGQLRYLAIEDKASGTGLIQDLLDSANTFIPVKAIERVKDKYTRVLDILGFIESGYVYLDENAPYLSDFLLECERFSADDSHLHDDMVDPMCDAINDMIALNSLNVWTKLGQQE